MVAVINESGSVWLTGSNDSPEQRNSRKVAFRMVTTFPGGEGVGGGGAARPAMGPRTGAAGTSTTGS